MVCKTNAILHINFVRGRALAIRFSTFERECLANTNRNDEAAPVDHIVRHPPLAGTTDIHLQKHHLK